MIENSAYRLAAAIKKTQKRANALKNITIPHYTQLSKDIADALEEKEREEFTRLKVIKQRKNKGKLIRLSRNRDEKPAGPRRIAGGRVLCVMQKICFG